MRINNPETNTFIRDAAGNLLHYSFEQYTGWDLTTDTLFNPSFQNVPVGATVFGVIASIYDDDGNIAQLPYVVPSTGNIEISNAVLSGAGLLFACRPGGALVSTDFNDPLVVRISALIFYTV